MSNENLNPVQILLENRPQEGDSEEVLAEKHRRRLGAQVMMMKVRGNLGSCANLASMATSVDATGDFSNYVEHLDRFEGRRLQNDE